MKMLAIMKYGNKAASTRARLLQYRRHLKEQDIELSISYLLNDDYLNRRFSGGRSPFFSIINSYIKRLWLLTDVSCFDLIWIQYESFPYLPGAMERIVLNSRKPVICDFDDAIFHQYDAHANPLIRYFLGTKLRPLMRGASLCLCGNDYLKSYVDRFCRHTEIIPTVVDTNRYVPGSERRDDAQPIVVGWIGSPSTWTFVQPVMPILQRLSEELNLIIRVVGAGRPPAPSFRFEFVEWSEDTEKCALQSMDIGIMPLPDDPWARGKCGLKLIQYMACGLPVIASPVGVNCELVEEGVNGFLASNERDWEAAIRRLVASAALRANLGARGRKKVVAGYSLHVHGPRLAALVREVADRSSAVSISSLSKHQRAGA